MINIRNMQRQEWPVVARLIHDSTNGWYVNRGMSPCFANGPESTLLFCEVYETLDPGCCLVAVDSDSDEIVGSCFWHLRPTHVSLGIMNVHPGHFGKGIAAKLLREITGIADERKLPVRLVSSAMNLDSFSLYNRAGFVPQTVFQDMLIHVTDAAISCEPVPDNDRVREAVETDVQAIVALEFELSGIQREGDFRFFIANKTGHWKTLVVEDAWGKLTGVLVAIRHPGSNMIGPGVSRKESEMIALTQRMLPFHENNTVVMLVPASAKNLTNALYVWGAKNCELHISQVRGTFQTPTGIVVPSFMPESG